jgi:3-oxoacyl-[acyl-carrier-protein] synthase II
LDRRIVITGLSAITSIGIGADDFYDNCIKGTINIENIPSRWLDYSDYNCNIWSPMMKVNFSDYNITQIEQKQLEKTTMLALSCSFDALNYAGLKFETADKKRNTYSINGIDPFKAGVMMGTGIGGISSFSEAFSYQILNNQKTRLSEIYDKGRDDSDTLKSINYKFIMPKRFNPFAVSMIMPNSSAANIGIKFGLKGLNNTISLACASGTGAIGYAFEAIKNGKLDFCITGGVEYMFDEYGGLFYAFDVLKTLCQPAEDIERSNRPFDENRTGFLFSEGGCAVLILEELESALKRNANIIAEIVSFSETCDAFNIMMIEPSGESIERAITAAIKTAGIFPENVDYINSHGTGTKLNDEVETAVIDKIFGKKPFVNSTKSLVGHTLGASGAIEALVTALSIKNKTIHGCKNLEKPIRSLNFPLKAEHADIKTAISQSFGFGGHNTALVFREFNG